MRPSLNLRNLLQSETAIRRIELGTGAILIGLIFWRLQYSTSAICCGDFDGYYHIKWSQILWQSFRHHNFRPTFTWLPLTTLNAHDYADHHFLFHLFQIPFTFFRDLRFGAKLAAIIFGSLAVFSCYWLLMRYQIRYFLVYLLALLACSDPFLYRLNMAKAPPFAIIYLVIAIHLLFKMNHWPLVLIASVFTLTYDMFPVLILAVFLWVAVIGWTERRFLWRPIMWVLLGTAVGLLINPYFPHNIHLFYEHLKMKMTASDYSTKVGQEWYPYNTWEFLGNSVVACTAMVVGYIAFDPSERERSQRPLFFLLFSTALMIMTARWKRIAEYWPAFAVMFAAFALQPWLEGGRSAFSKLPAHVMDELRPFFDRDKPTQPTKEERNKDLWRMAVAVSVGIILVAILLINLKQTTSEIANSEENDYYKAGAEWMRSQVVSGQIVFNTDWDDFPRLFYFDPTHNYVSGLDPNYLYDRDPALSQLYDRITLGEEQDPGPLIRDRFGARYVFTDNDHETFSNRAMESGWFDIVYEDRDCTILHIREEPQNNRP